MTKLIIDSFAGGGGASEGIRMALGRDPDVAINHDAEAIAMHVANHPGTRHLNSNVWQVDPLEATGGKPVGLAWFSPDCTHFSKARGGKPVKKHIRDLAWVVVLWAQRVRPDVIMMENVEEFQTWGPLTEDNRPCPIQSGLTFRKWKKELNKAGYKVDHRELRACDYGAPTIRKRLFLIARRDGLPIIWPEPTHGDPKSEAVLSGRLKPWRAAAEIIDWSVPIHSIFLTKEEARQFGVKRPLEFATMRRIARGVKRFVLDAARPFLVSLTHHGGDRVYSLDEPIHTITGAHRGEKAVVAPVFSYAQQGGASRSADEPLHTICASTKDQNQLVAPFMSRVDMTSAVERNGINSAETPLNTITTSNGLSLAAVHLTKFSENSTGVLPDEPLHTVMAGAPRHGVVAAFLAQHNAGPNNDGLAGRSAEEPVSTVTVTGSQQGLVAAALTQLRGTNKAGRSIGEPAPTIAAEGNHEGVVAAFMNTYYGTEQAPDLGEPLATVTTKDRFGVVTVTIDGHTYALTDIGMRMLTVRELFSAQGFRADYIIQPIVNGKPLTKTAATRMAGNSCSPWPVAAMVAANVNMPAVEIMAAE